MSRVAIIGGGPSGIMCAIIAKRKNPDNEIFVFEKNDILSTVLPTGGGRCNLSCASDDIKDFAKNYPRGEKFLYSIFNQFFIHDTIAFFESIGIKTYIQDDNRIFPVSNKSLDVIFALKNEIKRLGIKVINKEISDIKFLDNGFSINNKYFEKLVISTGGKENQILHKIGHNIIKQKPALSSLEITEKYFSNISGVSINNVTAIAQYEKHKEILFDDLLFTHKGISGPLVYKISSLFANDSYDKNNPIKIHLNFWDKEIDMQKFLNENSQKEIINLFSMFIPKSLAKILLEKENMNISKKCNQINKIEREKITKLLVDLEINAISPIKGGEIVSSGGVDLKEINPKTLESRIHKNLYFCGEVINVDGFCGGYNLQNCWSTGYVAGISL